MYFFVLSHFLFLLLVISFATYLWIEFNWHVLRFHGLELRSLSSHRSELYYVSSTCSVREPFLEVNWCSLIKNSANNPFHSRYSFKRSFIVLCTTRSRSYTPSSPHTQYSPALAIQLHLKSNQARRLWVRKLWGRRFTRDKLFCSLCSLKGDEKFVQVGYHRYAHQKGLCEVGMLPVWNKDLESQDVDSRRRRFEREFFEKARQRA